LVNARITGKLSVRGADMSGRKTIAILVDYLMGDYQTALVEGVREGAKEHDFNLLVLEGRALDAPSPIDAGHNSVYERLAASRVDGVILASGCIGIYAGPGGLSAFCERLAPLPLCSVSTQLPGVPSLTISNRGGSCAIVEHMLEEHGCKRIVYLRGPAESQEAEERLLGYRAAIDAHGLDYDEQLIEMGNFWVASGEQAMQRILERGVAFDAVVAANDYMALGAVSALRAAGLRVPRDAIIAGFDDSPSSRLASPSLSTVRQPWRRLAQAAVATLARQFAGESVPAYSELGVDVVLRQSCGCGYRVVRGPSSGVSPASQRDILAELVDRRAQLLALMVRMVGFERALAPTWPERLLDALREELSGQAGRFLLELGDIMDELQPRSEAIDDFNHVIGALRAHFRDSPPNRATELDELWHGAIHSIGQALNRSQMRKGFAADLVQEALRESIERLTASLNHHGLCETLRDVAPRLGIGELSIGLYSDATQSSLRPLLLLSSDATQDGLGAAIPSSRLGPDVLFTGADRFEYVLMPLTFGVEQLGLVLFGQGAQYIAYRMLREQIGASLKGADLMRGLVDETGRRERAEREQLHKEVLIAQGIQTAVLPRTMAVAGLAIAASMQSATDAGGDYYDVLPTEDGCWLAIGDVTGHGLVSCIVMLMMQSMIGAMVEVHPKSSPRDVFVKLNAALYKNLHDRLRRDECATLTLFRYEQSGVVTFAGMHEEIVIWRAASRRCERIATDGIWLAALPDAAGRVVDRRLELQPEDVLVLYTDGVTEAMDVHHEHFELGRLCAVIEANCERPVEELCSAITRAVDGWRAMTTDDVTVLVARHTGEVAAAQASE
jgi:DNA-binding LacI/PurR family transcriptional regulator/serine phosphatase RsbU (regulator of sigma subunit)